MTGEGVREGGGRARGMTREWRLEWRGKALGMTREWRLGWRGRLLRGVWDGDRWRQVGAVVMGMWWVCAVWAQSRGDFCVILDCSILLCGNGAWVALVCRWHLGGGVSQDSISLKALERQSGIRLRLEEREECLSPLAAKSSRSAGRAVSERPSDVRTEYQRDRDRIIHCKAFRRLKHKTQVFIAPLGDHYVTRLTHTLEVGQIARTIARALNLNEDLAEAIAMGHDLGHTPFGHIGEDELDKIHPAGFRHSRQSLNIVERIERDGRGLNLTWEVRQGILKHSKPRGDFLSIASDDLTLEAQIVRISDAVAYLNHDLADAFRAGVLSAADLPANIANTLGRRHSERVDTIVCDIIAHSYQASGLNGARADVPVAITMGDEVRSAFMELREFMFTNVYMPQDEQEKGFTARRIMRFLYNHFTSNHDEIPPEYARRSRTKDEAVVDYVSGMTDLYAIRVAERLSPGIGRIFSERLL